MNRSRLLYLIQRYSDNTATPSELEELSAFTGSSEDYELFSEVMMDQMKDGSTLSNEDLLRYEELADRALERHKFISPEPVPFVPGRRRWYGWAAAAACILLLLSVRIYFGKQRNVIPAIAEADAPAPSVILPGQNGALLTLADGSTIVLDSSGSAEKISGQNGADIVIQQGKLAYMTAGEHIDQIAYNTLSTPKGRQYHIQLHDGTKVWLNAASSIHYPTVFTGQDRVVEVTGEAYFEVAKDPSHPFKVKLNQQAEIEVIGTHFNVNAYSNEPAITTTLLEGSVRFSIKNDALGRKNKVLRPGEQTKLNNETLELTTSSDVETARVIAWKDGLFDFNDAGLREAMQQLERWYDIEVTYEKNIPDIRFFGKMTKNITLNDLLLILEKSKVHFQIDGRKIIVKP
ncbi:MAG: FecR domain-containing protein [Chitinophagaceae bacterium]|nr:FecR domain-containing protein [Chitinophagaceae bacterium]